MGHYAFYEAMEREGEIRFIQSSEDLDASVAAWENPALNEPVGLILAMESIAPSSPAEV